MMDRWGTLCKKHRRSNVARGFFAAGQFAVRKNVSFGQIWLVSIGSGFLFLTTNCPAKTKNITDQTYCCPKHWGQLEHDFL